MWNKRREDEFIPRPPSSAAQPVENRESAAPASAAPKPSGPEPPRGVAAIGKSVLIKGQIVSREDLYLDGEIEGTIEVPDHRLTVGPHAKLQASVIRAREVTVLGAISGNLEAAEKIEIRKDGRLTGDIKAGGIVIEDGAYFKGSIDIVRSEAPKTASQPRPQQPAAVPSASVNPVAAIASDGGKR